MAPSIHTERTTHFVLLQRYGEHSERHAVPNRAKRHLLRIEERRVASYNGEIEFLKATRKGETSSLSGSGCGGELVGWRGSGVGECCTLIGPLFACDMTKLKGRFPCHPSAIYTTNLALG